MGWLATCNSVNHGLIVPVRNRDLYRSISLCTGCVQNGKTPVLLLRRSFSRINRFAISQEAQRSTPGWAEALFRPFSPEVILMKSSDPPRTFAHLHLDNGMTEIICMNCLATICSGLPLEERLRAQADHICDLENGIPSPRRVLPHP